MTITADFIRLWNLSHSKLGLTDARMAELTIELGQLHAAIEGVREKVTFDGDVFDFRMVVHEISQKGLNNELR